MLKKYTDVLLIFLIILVVAKLIFIVNTINMGFDVTDEGWFLLNLNFPDKDTSAFSQMHKVVNMWFPFLEFNVVNVRLLRLVLEMFSMVFLAICTLQYAKNKGTQVSVNQYVFIIFFMLLGLYTSAFSRNLGYFELTFVLLAISVGFYLLQHKRKSFVLAALLGCLQSWIFLCKFSSGILSFLLFAVLLSFFEKSLRKSIVYFIGFAFAFTLFLWHEQLSFSMWWESFNHGLITASLLGYGITDLIEHVYLKELIAVVILAIGLRWLFSFLIQKEWKNYFAFLMCAFIDTVSFVLIFPDPITFLGRYSVSHGWYMLSFLPLIFCVMLIRDIKNSPELLILLLIPFIAIAGSDTVFSINLFSVLYPTLLFLAVRISDKKLLPVVTLFLIVITSGAFIFNAAINPYRIHTSILDQDVEITTQQGESIYVDDSLSVFYNSLSIQLQDVEKPSPLVALYDLPGMVYLLGHYSPETPWYFSGEASQKFNEYNLNRVHTSMRLVETSEKTDLFWNKKYYLLQK